ncbi:hypothetical protein SUGI_0904790 [Cryptomeria japonica]|nr:hypothetical protein SUGI_0904790 [Cryptomeria japonica]
MRTKTLSSLFSSSDNIILNKWRQTCIPFKGVLIGKMPKSEHCREVKWERPSKSYMNLNLDGASRRNPGRSGAGCVIQDHGGHIKKSLLVRLPDGSNNMAVASTMLERVKLVISLGISKLYIEGDSYIITSAIVSKKVVNLDLKYVLAEVWRLLPRFQAFKVSHFFREGNQFVDILANLGVNLDLCLRLLDGMELIKIIKEQIVSTKLAKNKYCSFAQEFP